MSALKSLTLTALPKAEHSPVQLRRSRLIERLEQPTAEGASVRALVSRIEPPLYRFRTRDN